MTVPWVQSISGYASNTCSPRLRQGSLLKVATGDFEQFFEGTCLRMQEAPLTTDAAMEAGDPGATSMGIPPGQLDSDPYLVGSGTQAEQTSAPGPVSPPRLVVDTRSFFPPPLARQQGIRRYQPSDDWGRWREYRSRCSHSPPPLGRTRLRKRGPQPRRHMITPGSWQEKLVVAEQGSPHWRGVNHARATKQGKTPGCRLASMVLTFTCGALHPVASLALA